MNKAVIVCGYSTAVGVFSGVITDVAAIDLGALVLRETPVRA
jgi:hypothetical protein